MLNRFDIVNGQVKKSSPLYFIMAVVTLSGLSRCFLSKQRACNSVVCDRSSCSHTTLLQRFVLGAGVFKKP